MNHIINLIFIVVFNNTNYIFDYYKKKSGF